ncbi:NAD(P)-binding protein [Bimuria novae-zelandiae CBS 107.79]|uniref:NAD(P)-binding protein n=1 Tax=Bimuria novae-zelandiae CBS 107.79 TaxID=1447943 RepID=A0A6A5VCE2_9PLEO|nr:NAD(P)-binding protein [Bimuria novae-zelandiae CBS 107.79]
MLASCRLDGALVCTPNHTHVAISKELLNGGVHVLCEKPISVDIASGQELIDCAKASGRHLIGHHRRFNRYVVAAKNALPSLGKIVAVSGLWTIYKPPEYFNPPLEWHRLDSAGPILINLIHEADLLQYWFGPIVRVFAEKAASQRGFAAEEGAAMTLRFATGIVGTFVLSDAVVSLHNFESGTGENPTIPQEGRDSYRIFGSESRLSFPDMTMWTYEGKRSWTERLAFQAIDVPDMKIPFELQIRHFVRVIKGEEAPCCSGRDGLRAVAVCEAVKRSILEGLPVDIPVDDR